MTVSDWPSYIIRGIPADTRALLSHRSEQGDVSLADVVRLALCHRYQLDCDPASFRYQAHLDSGNDTILVRIQPEVWAAMKKETRGRYGETKKLILESLNTYLEGTQT